MIQSKVYWIKLISKFVSIQLVVQALGFLSGILLVRTLSKEEYAFFTLANTMQGAMNVLADSGISSALSAIGGKVWQNPYRFGQLINTAMKWRYRLAFIAILTVTPILVWTLLQNKASIAYTIIITTAIVIELNFYQYIGVLSSVLRLNTQITRLQKIALIGAGSRIILLGISFKILNAGVATIISAITSALQTIVLFGWIEDKVDRKAPVNEQDSKEIQKLIASQLPNAIFYCIQGQLVILLISLFGNTQDIANIGALSRLGIIFSLFSSVMTDILLPSFARCQSYKPLVIKYIQIILLYIGLTVSLNVLVYLFPSTVLWILGNQYSNLEKEAILIIMSSSIGSFAAILWSINASKGWIDLAWLIPPTIITAQIILLFILNLSSVTGIILFNALSVIPTIGLHIFMTYRGLKQYS
uniref:Polysaccharide biosynthesis protein n=1 Tax=Cyanothece sp. (strain PCC 7425 / ATCC 29141) TaxID=395961 RepID=B8HNC1_CYAP4